MRIRELAAAADVPADTIRHYEKAGLIAAPPRGSNGYRDYAERDLARLRFIRHCRELDMSLPEVRELLHFLDHPSPDCSAADRVVQQHLAHVRERLAALRRLERQLVRLVAACAHPKPEQRCGIALALSAPDAPTGSRHRVARRPTRGVHTA
jgi:DNA-binding transcriptional MerR regulator